MNTHSYFSSLKFLRKSGPGPAKIFSRLSFLIKRGGGGYVRNQNVHLSVFVQFCRTESPTHSILHADKFLRSAPHNRERDMGSKMFTKVNILDPEE